MRAGRWLLGVVMVLATLPIGSCGSDKPKLCDSCSSDADCVAGGYTCQLFQGGSKRCSDANPNSTCPSN